MIRFREFLDEGEVVSNRDFRIKQRKKHRPPKWHMWLGDGPSKKETDDWWETAHGRKTNVTQFPKKKEK